MGVKENKEKNGSKKDRNRAAIELRVETKLTVLFSLLYEKKKLYRSFHKKINKGLISQSSGKHQLMQESHKNC